MLKEGYSEHAVNAISKSFDEDIDLIKNAFYTKVSIYKGENILKEEATKIIDYYLLQGETRRVDN